MSEPFTGQLALFGFSFAPAKWTFCQGQLLPISQNTQLFSLLGTQYGGNGVSTFALPNLMGFVAIGQGQLLGGALYEMGEEGGTPFVTLNSNQSPAHSHALQGTTAVGTVNTAAGNLLARPETGAGLDAARGNIYNTTAAPDTQLLAKSITPSGTNSPAPHNNMQPYLALNYCICLAGIFPARN